MTIRQPAHLVHSSSGLNLLHRNKSNELIYASFVWQIVFPVAAPYIQRTELIVVPSIDVTNKFKFSFELDDVCVISLDNFGLVTDRGFVLSPNYGAFTHDGEKRVIDVSVRGSTYSIYHTESWAAYNSTFDSIGVLVRNGGYVSGETLSLMGVDISQPFKFYITHHTYGNGHMDLKITLT